MNILGLERVAKISVEENGVEDVDGSIEVVVEVQNFRRRVTG